MTASREVLRKTLLLVCLACAGEPPSLAEEAVRAENQRLSHETWEDVGPTASANPRWIQGTFGAATRSEIAGRLGGRRVLDSLEGPVQRISGWVSMGGEADVFRPCAGNHRWWIRPASAVVDADLAERYRYRVSRPDRPAFFVLEGVLRRDTVAAGRETFTRVLLLRRVVADGSQSSRPCRPGASKGDP